ncbi:CC142-like protein [Mya arenaria]|uniref:CC142-like protein n=1 Tax=Mya arenaria TaxID=6604 RepID=A0ABY7FIE2_MYAAR|nr:CC142-like protein [Mya arenaria]
MDLSSLPPLQGQLSFANSSVEFSDGFGVGGFISEREHVNESGTETRAFNVNDGEEAVKCLRRAFQLGRPYISLRHHLEERARVELLRDCLYRLKTSASFVRDLQILVADEYKEIYKITHDCVDEIPVSKIFCLNALCEDLRTLVGHWKCIKQKLHTNRWLQPVLGSMVFQLDRIRVNLLKLQEKAIWWLEKFVIVGLQVFAHGNVDAVTHEMIWNITRGLEDFNNIVNGIQTPSPTSRHGLQSTNVLRLYSLSAESSNSFACLGEHVKALPFTRVLSILANERSKYAALETHRFFTNNGEFVKLLYSGRLPNYIWTEESSHTNDKIEKETSDYHTATGSMTSLSAAILKVGSIRAPDLTDSDSPLVELGRREHNFAENFLYVVCSSTNLLQKKDNQRSRRAVKLTQSFSSAKPPKGDTPVLSRSDSLRKSVSWGDSADSSIKSQLVSRYMDLYWSHFGANLHTMFYEPCWIRKQSLYYSDIGSVIPLNTTIIAVVKHMMQHVCLKDLFPPGSVTPMLTAAKKSMHIAAFGAWDKCICEALASQRSDKCYPCPLVGGDYSTRTGMLLRDTFQPVLNLLREQLAESIEPSQGGIPSSVSEMASVSMRLVVTSSASLQWCRYKTHQYLASMAVANFLLISQTDLKFAKNCTSAAHDYFKTNMATGKQWRKKPDSGAVSGHNIYIEHVLETVLEPVLEGVGKLRQTVQLTVISQAVEALCQAWLNFILQEKIKFSYTGACQLGVDARYMRTWLKRSIAMEAVQQSILDLPVLKTLTDEDSAHIQGERSVYESEDCISHVSNPNDWLALRVNGGGRSWRSISGCLNPDPQ